MNDLLIDSVALGRRCVALRARASMRSPVVLQVGGGGEKDMGIGCEILWSVLMSELYFS